MPKLECLCSTIEQESVVITFVSELWLTPDIPLHTRELDRRFNLEGLQFFTNSRATQRGGGVGIIINTGKGYSATRLQVNSRTGKNSIEVIWVLVTPSLTYRGSRQIHLCMPVQPPKIQVRQCNP